MSSLSNRGHFKHGDFENIYFSGTDYDKINYKPCDTTYNSAITDMVPSYVMRRRLNYDILPRLKILIKGLSSKHFQIHNAKTGHSVAV